MPTSFDLKMVNYPSDGWTSSWGLRNAPRPGGQSAIYWAKTTDATGLGEPLNHGIIIPYNDTGTVDFVGYVSSLHIFGSATPIDFTMSPNSGDATAVDVHFWAARFLPNPLVDWWDSFTTLTFPTAREPFIITAPGLAPFPFVGDIPNPITLTPLTNYAASIWRPVL